MKLRSLVGVLALLLSPVLGCGDDDGGNQNQNGNLNNDNQSNPVCGNGVLETGETCDDGPDNSDTTPGACRIDCRPAYCGDGVVDPGEPCDDGNEDPDDPCLPDCTPNTCGDGHPGGPDEACDDGPDNSDVRSHACRTDCRLPHCGDGVFDPDLGEACDDATLSEAGACDNACQRRDGFVINSAEGIGFIVGADFYQTAATPDGTHLVLVQFPGEPPLSGGTRLDRSVIDPSGAIDAATSTAQPLGGLWSLTAAPAGFSVFLRPQTFPTHLVERRLDPAGEDAETVTWVSTVACTDALDAAWHPIAGLALLHGPHPRADIGCVTATPGLQALADPAGSAGFTSSEVVAGTYDRARITAYGAGFLVLRPDEGGAVWGHVLDASALYTGFPELDVTGGLVLSGDNTDPPRADRGIDGATLIVWSSGAGETQVYARLLRADGTFAGLPFALASTASGTLAAPDVAATADGTYLVVWGRENLGEREVRGRFVSADGQVLDADLRLGTFLTSTERGFTMPRVSTSRRGALVVWVSNDPSIDQDVLVGTFLPRRVD